MLALFSGEFVKRHGLQAKDILVIYKNKKSGRYVCNVLFSPSFWCTLLFILWSCPSCTFFVIWKSLSMTTCILYVSFPGNALVTSCLCRLCARLPVQWRLRTHKSRNASAWRLETSVKNVGSPWVLPPRRLLARCMDLCLNLNNQKHLKCGFLLLLCWIKPATELLWFCVSSFKLNSGRTFRRPVEQIGACRLKEFHFSVSCSLSWISLFCICTYILCLAAGFYKIMWLCTCTADARYLHL